MATTTSRNAKERRSVKESARQAARRAFKQWLAKLPNELASDLEELFAMMSAAGTESDRKEIAATITELLYPDTLIVELDKNHRLDFEDQAARNKLRGYRKNVGKAIAKFRNEKGWNQTQLGEAVGISQSHVCRLETGFHAPTHVTIEKVAKALGVCPSQIDPGFDSTVDAE